MIPDLTAVIVNYRSAAKAVRCAATLREAFARESIGGEIVLVDCGSGEGEAGALRSASADAAVLLPENRGYSGGVNAGLARARAPRLLLSNADVEYGSGCLSALIAAVDDPAVGAAAPVSAWDAAGRVLLPPGFDPGFLAEMSLLRSGRSPARDARRFAAFARDAVRLWTRGGRARHLTGAVLAARRDVFDRAGRFDERFPFEYEETEWEGRVRRCGLELRLVAEARVRHLWGGSASGDAATEKRRAASRRLFRERRYGRIGRALLERASRPVPPGSRRATRESLEVPARPGDWLALSPHASGIPFAGVDLSTPFRLPPEVRDAMPPGPWAWTVFRGADGRPLESWSRDAP